MGNEMIRRAAPTGRGLAAMAWAAALLLAPAARGDVTYNVTIDENGHGTLVNNTTGARTTLSFEWLLLPNGQANGLQYNLADGGAALAATVGDRVALEVAENNPGGNTISDVVRFLPPATGGNTTTALTLYSNYAAGSDESPADLADVLQLPSVKDPNPIQETGTELVNSFTFTPAAGAPGFIAGGVTYVVLSDVAVPEPSSLILLGLALPAALALRLARGRGTGRPGKAPGTV